MEFKRTFDILQHGVELYNGRPVLAIKNNGSWIEFDIDKYREQADHLSYGLLALGLKKGDKVSTIANNRPEWNFVDMAVSQTGMVHVPIYPTIGNEEYRHILDHSETRVVFVADKALYEKLKPIVDEIPAIIGMYTFSSTEGIPFWHEISEKGRLVADQYRLELEKIKQSISPDDICSIIYTSGTTGLSKGVMISHKNFLSNVEACHSLFPLVPGDKALSFLPLSHVFERMVNYYYQTKGVSVYYAESLATIGENLKEVKPQVFCSVPRVLEKTFDKIISVGKDLRGIKRIIFFWAVRIGYKYQEDNRKRVLYRFKLSIARKLVFKKWLAALGGNLKFAISGGAALQPRLARVFWAAGVPVLEGYGLTETSPVIAVNHAIQAGNIKFGSVGPKISNIEVRIAEDGEILMRGPSLMKGYYKNQELTDEVIDKEGWFHTGDIGYLAEGKFITITDRKKEIFKMSNGKYVAPQVLENKLKESFFIEQCMIVGENEKFVSALISPNFSFLHDWCSRHKIHYDNNQDLITTPEVITRFQKEINLLNKQLGDYEQIKRFRLVEEQWSPQTGELSPTLKLRRKVIYDRYEPVLEDIFNHAKQVDVRGIN